MLVDLKLFFSGANALVFAGILCAVGLVTKYLAAWFTGIIYQYTKYERNIIFGLSVSHAAATLAILDTTTPLNPTVDDDCQPPTMIKNRTAR